MEKARNVMREVRRDEGKTAAGRSDQEMLQERSEPQAGSSRYISAEQEEEHFLSSVSCVGRERGFFRVSGLVGFQ